jgi:hypothetical protein
MRNTTVLALVLAALPLSAQAQSSSVRQVFQEFGLIGVWARACDQPANLAGGNPHAIYALASSGGVMLTYDNGPQYSPSVYNILSAQHAGPNRLTYVEERLRDKQRVTVTVVKSSNEISLWSSVLPDGTVLVQNGRLTKTGLTNPPQVRCN